ncbi:hypothetical protein E2C01_015231 [Portunus trituberculatus]|uniref:Uncharacterized protein n=1 Tax=Portunus trituberculatus TaxID=210409 RepID=A0A5B7DL43_PORTR|nr:hypothetical protein [Portunus trituberculatus]
MALSVLVRAVFACLGDSIHTILLDRVESKPFRLINSLPLTYCLQPLCHH